MALGSTSRRWLMGIAWTAVCIAGALYLGLRLGRPMYYTDGRSELAGGELMAAGMVRWTSPVAEVEVPGPVSGRIAALPDGRLVYGRLDQNGSADLVQWHPARPDVPPEPLAGLNTPYNELAPTVAGDGRLLFASDRPGGAGGYDLYEAPSLQSGGAAVQPVAACNTALDETDAALSPDGRELVFVRSDRRNAGGNDGALWLWQVGDARDPAPLGTRPRGAIQRDPAFAPDGGALWFVQHQLGQRLELRRSSRLAGEWDEPVAMSAEWGVRELRSPLPAADGRSLQLLSAVAGDGGSHLLYRSLAQEVYPWWSGQRWLEWLLLSVVGTGLLVLLLLHFGRRWAALDLLAQCLLLSLLLHLLLFLWLMGVEVARDELPGRDDGGLQVDVQIQAVASASALAGAGADISAEVQFQPTERSLAASAPGSQVARTASGPVEAAAAERAAAATMASTTSDAAAAELADAPAPVQARDGVDAPAAPIAALPTPIAASGVPTAPTAARAMVGGETVVVSAPGSGVQRASPQAQQLAAAAAAPAAATSAAASSATAAAEGPEPALQDAPIAAAVQPNQAEADSAEGAPPPVQAAAVLATGPTAGPAIVAERPATADAGTPAGAAAAAAASPPRAALARGGAALPTAAAANRPAGSPVATQSAAAAAATALRDQPAVRVEPAAAAAASALPAAAAPPRPAPQPLAAVAGPRPSAPSAERSDALPTGRGATPVATPPGSALRRATGRALAAGATPSTASTPTPAAVRPSGPAAAVRDAADLTGAVRSQASDAVAARAGIAPAAVRDAVGPLAAALPSPVRSSAAGDSERPLRPPSPPKSKLVRPRPAPAPALASAVPLPGPLAASAYSNRFGPQKAQALERFGGTDATERAVQSGLRYLARRQRADGGWGDAEQFDGKYGYVYVGKTALCLLAFLGAGHTPTSKSEFSAVAQKAVSHLLAIQEEETGAFGPSSCYGHGIATYALAECYGITKAPELEVPLTRALTWIVDHQGPRRDRRNRGGWGYFSPGLQPDDDYARVSVSSWMIMALESARMSGVELPADVMPKAREYLELAYDQPNGWFRYNHKPSRINSAWPTLPASTPAAAFCLRLLGLPAEDSRIAAAVAYTVERRPQRYRRYGDDDFVTRGQGNVYFWYYGTLCCFLQGGEAWQQWNQRLSTVLPAAQADDGSFPPIDVYAEQAGDTNEDRCYTTAMCVLSLEVYYRYFTPLLLGRN